MKPLWGAALLLLLCAAACAQNSCVCQKNKRVTNCQLVNGVCQCQSVGSGVPVDCSTLTSKCLLMKAEMRGSKSGRREKPKDAFEDTDGLYDPECENTGVFKAKQCNGTTCWCVNTAGVRRTDKHDADLKCNQLVRTMWIIIEIKHGERNTPLHSDVLDRFFKQLITSRYMLDGRYISSVLYEEPLITIDLKQNSSEKSSRDVDIADVAYYLEKDLKGDSIFHENILNMTIDNERLLFEKVAVYYVDEIPPEFSMKSLTPGLIAVIVIVVIAIVAGIVVLVLTRRRKGKYVKAEVKEMNEMHRGLNA
ncbi:PREDICTED: epithelial cell adhesion molecule isoform X2 [Calidris pugnax]|uniref:epithelial cell adhesion molecule isoform X1 n=1 Tax=Calidris pugnax TaxID=198806 RepID=UPI00071C675E|nr:PREDICTED: epithelial cell adhesion molecule isoform X1 [Calidris pugnax]XP_014817848.1 PREDICTED: epithelial cell adhesion molecule isoform X2 [Calidris pugnax]